MNSQLYTAASGLLVEQRRLEMISNNLANLSTTGFRAQRSFSTVYRGFAPEADGHPANKAVALAGAYTVPGPGPMIPTGRGLDVAIKNEGLFVLETPTGRRYTRDGALSVSKDGGLVDASGNRLLGAGGKPIAGAVPTATIEADGRLMDGQIELARLLVVRDPRGILQPDRGNLLSAAGQDNALETVVEPELVPASLEGSATNALKELVELIDAQRAFEGYQKLVSMTMNEVNRRAVNEIAG